MMILKFEKGFTLVELMVTVAIVGILAALAYPSYMETVRRSNRAEAKVEMADIAQRLQACYTTYGTYISVNCPTYQTGFNTSPSYITTRGSGFYQVTISNATATTYTLTATAVLPPQTLDTTNGCNVLTQTHLGVQGPTVCWQK